MLVFDEVQCGVARTGTFYAYEQYGIAPDILATAKGIGGGFPLGACLATEKAARGMGLGTHGSTYGGNPLAMAAGEAVLDVVADQEFLAEVRAKGDRIAGRLEQFIGNYPELFELVRGRGLMLGLKMRIESRPFVAHLRDNHGLLTVAAGDNTVRILPPLVIDDSHIDEFMDKLSAGAASYQPEPVIDDAAFPQPVRCRRRCHRGDAQRCADRKAARAGLAQGPARCRCAARRPCAGDGVREELRPARACRSTSRCASSAAARSCSTARARSSAAARASPIPRACSAGWSMRS